MPCPTSDTDTPGPTDTDDSNLWRSNDASLPSGALDDLPSEVPLVDEDELHPKKAKRPHNADGSKPEVLANNTTVLCQQCTVETHTQNPFHHIDRWTNKQGYWNRTSMCMLNPVIHLSHGGKKCHYSGTAPYPLTIVHEHSVDKICVTYCDCSEMWMDNALQLICFGLFSALWKVPDTVFMIHVMEEFHLLGLQMQMNAHDFMTYLRRLQNNVCPDKVMDQYFKRG
ncbi:hypothetical protein EWM64_g10519 [Hericium alpestre]|uniref:CxC2-like cysteine cluster KDZ transposase-associated domain-containing protein n=1 Tax=Hericium alpestre TaxID=135208 RepID=A0A4Y9ZGF0_9AGAM|nr:hypothetical protein EWM64_g10519 [Hericium alpestre]